jgi:uncharacterized membrane protein
MRTPANIAKHPIHPMLVTIPIGLWVFSFVCDLVYLSGKFAGPWSTVALYTMVGGVVGALLAAVPGLIDLLSLPSEPRKTAIYHMVINLTVVAIYAVNVWLRLSAPENLQGPIWLSVIAIGLLLVSGWLGGKMVYVYGIAVDTPAEPVSTRGSAERSQWSEQQKEPLRGGQRR